MDILSDAGLVVLILSYGYLLARRIPPSFHFVSNIAFSLVVLFGARAFGYSLNDLGLGTNLFSKGILVAVLASVIILFIAFIATRIPYSRKLLLGQKSILQSTPAKIAYETTIRIPYSTALTEEIIFRGVLLGVLISHHGVLNAMIISSATFGLWHIFPAINSLNQNVYKKQLSQNRGGFLLMNVGLTTLAGMVFSWLRVLSGSILAPWLVHWTINSSAVISVVYAGKVHKRHK